MNILGLLTRSAICHSIKFIQVSYSPDPSRPYRRQASVDPKPTQVKHEVEGERSCSCAYTFACLGGVYRWKEDPTFILRSYFLVNSRIYQVVSRGMEAILHQESTTSSGDQTRPSTHMITSPQAKNHEYPHHKHEERESDAIQISGTCIKQA